MSLDLIKQALLASYETYGGINHLDGANLPSEESVDRLASDLMHVLFPGFFEQSSVTKKNIGTVIERRLGEISARLATEIENACASPAIPGRTSTPANSPSQSSAAYRR